MANLKLEGSPKTPTVSFDDATGLLELRGRSIPENSIDFYKPLIDWVDRYSKTPPPKPARPVPLAAFNPSRTQCSLDLFKKLEMVRQTGNDVTVFWHSEADDEGMLE